MTTATLESIHAALTPVIGVLSDADLLATLRDAIASKADRPILAALMAEVKARGLSLKGTGR